jgi:hypothetical protein
MTTISSELDDQLLVRVQQLAAVRNLTVSQMVQRLLEVRMSATPSPAELGPITRSLTGIAPPMTDEEVQRVLDEERMRKYGGQ